jgi:hypothetical protein
MVRVERRPTLVETLGNVESLATTFFSLYSGSDKHTLWMTLNRVTKSLKSHRATAPDENVALGRSFLISTFDQHPPIQVSLDPAAPAFPKETLAGLLRVVYQQVEAHTAIQPLFKVLTTAFDGIDSCVIPPTIHSPLQAKSSMPTLKQS